MEKLREPVQSQQPGNGADGGRRMILLSASLGAFESFVVKAGLSEGDKLLRSTSRTALGEIEGTLPPTWRYT